MSNFETRQRELREKATPGPWSLIPKGGPQGRFPGLISESKGWIVADRIFGSHDDENANLIMAAIRSAPLVEELVAAARNITDSVPAGDDRTIGQIVTEDAAYHDFHISISYALLGKLAAALAALDAIASGGVGQ